MNGEGREEAQKSVKVGLEADLVSRAGPQTSDYKSHLTAVLRKLALDGVLRMLKHPLIYDSYSQCETHCSVFKEGIKLDVKQVEWLQAHGLYIGNMIPPYGQVPLLFVIEVENDRISYQFHMFMVLEYESRSLDTGQCQVGYINSENLFFYGPLNKPTRTWAHATHVSSFFLSNKVPSVDLFNHNDGSKHVFLMMYTYNSMGKNICSAPW